MLFSTDRGVVWAPSVSLGTLGQRCGIGLRSRGLLVGLAVVLSLPGCAPRPARPNILLISIDALRADAMGAYGHPRNTTPFLDSLAARGQLFTKAYVPLPATAPSHATLLTSLHPAQHGVVANTMALPEQAETLAEVLRANGYVTLGAVAVFYLKARYGFGQGFDAFSDQWNARVRGNSPERRSATDVNGSVSSMLSSYAKQRPAQPVFLFVHYYDVHAPYVMRPRYNAPQPVLPSPSGSASAREMLESYDSGVEYVDAHIRQLYERLVELGLARNLLVCVTSDHGEQLGEHGYARGHADIYRETIRVPLVLQGTGVPQEQVEHPTSSMDVALSILARLGLRFQSAAASVAAELGGARPWTEPAPQHRPFLVLGYPGHTHSLALIQDDLWYIRNLDGLYREALVERPRPRASTLPPGFQKPREVARNGTETLYVIDPVFSDGVAAVQVTVEARLERQSCRAELSLALHKRLRYFANPLPFDGAIRLHVPATSRDRIVISLRAESCRSDVFYRKTTRDAFERERSTLVPTPRVIETALWRKLPIPRKSRLGDELYDIRADPGMLANLLDADQGREPARRLDALIDRLWNAYGRRALAEETMRAETAEEHEALRSLGYIR